MAAAPQELQDLLQANGSVARDEAWGRFVNRFSPLLLHTARSVGRNHDRAMDCYAFVLERLREDRGRRLRAYTETPGTQFTTWLVVVARRLCLDHLRQRYGRVGGDAPAEREQLVNRRRLADLIAVELSPEDVVTSRDEGPDRQLRRSELMAALDASLARLPAPDRLLLALRFEEDLPAREIARILRLPTPFHVYRAINALLGELRLALGRRGVEDAQP